MAERVIMTRVLRNHQKDDGSFDLDFWQKVGAEGRSRRCLGNGARGCDFSGTRWRSTAASKVYYSRYSRRWLTFWKISPEAQRADMTAQGEGSEFASDRNPG